MTPKRLSSLQRRFCEEYTVDAKGTQAAIRAGYKARTARQAAAKNMANPQVRAVIDQLQEDRSKRTGVTADRVVDGLADLAFSDIRKLFHADGTMKLPGELDNATAAAVASIETSERTDEDGKIVRVRKVRLWDKKGALEQLGKHLGLFRDRIELTGSVAMPVSIAEVVVFTREQAELLDKLKGTGFDTGAMGRRAYLPANGRDAEGAGVEQDHFAGANKL